LYAVILSAVTKGNEVEGPAFAFVVAFAFLAVIPEGNLLHLRATARTCLPRPRQRVLHVL